MDYDVVKASVSAAYKNFGQNDDKFYGAMKTFYAEGKNNPSVARIIMQDHIANNRIAVSEMLKDAVALSSTDVNALLHPEIYTAQNGIYNLALNSALKSIQADDIYKNSAYIGTENEDPLSLGSIEKKEFDNSWNNKYPKTGDIRKRIIEANRLKMDSVTSKAGWFEKINFAKTFGEYRESYPKTFYTRYLLVMNEQIKQNEVTSRVSNWFKRLYYKSFIKKGYGFKK